MGRLHRRHNRSQARITTCIGAVLPLSLTPAGALPRFLNSRRTTRQRSNLHGVARRHRRNTGPLGNRPPHRNAPRTGRCSRTARAHAKAVPRQPAVKAPHGTPTGRRPMRGGEAVEAPSTQIHRGMMAPRHRPLNERRPRLEKAPASGQTTPLAAHNLHPAAPSAITRGGTSARGRASRDQNVSEGWRLPTLHQRGNRGRRRPAQKRRSPTRERKRRRTHRRRGESSGGRRAWSKRRRVAVVGSKDRGVGGRGSAKGWVPTGRERKRFRPHGRLEQFIFVGRSRNRGNQGGKMIWFSLTSYLSKV